MLRGLPSANRLNTHITHTPSFLISLLCVWVLSQLWRWGTDAARPHVSKCRVKQAQISNTGCELWTNTTEADMQHGMTTKWGFPWKKKKWGDFQCNPFNLFRSGMGGVVVIIPIRVIKTSLCMCQRTAAFLFFLPLHRVSKASAHYKPISLYQLIFTFDSVAVLMGVGTRVSVHRNLNNVMKPGADLIYNPMPWLNSIMSFSSPLFVGNKGKLRL